ncbi:MAG: 50S ribosomal protein L30 [DPANN group archaeon]|nr:50S ribosomal protein L30 [DPANN group archaeon]
MAAEKTEKSSGGEKRAWLAVIRVRGDVGLHPRVRSAFRILKLYKKNYCILVLGTRDTLRTVQTIKDFATFGEISQETFAKLLQKRGRIMGDKPLTQDYIKQKINTDFQVFISDVFSFKRKLDDIPGVKTFFRLHPPAGGFERGGIKQNYAQSGALGYRGKEINKLIERMM